MTFSDWNLVWLSNTARPRAIVYPWIHQAEDRNSFRGNVPKVYSTKKNLAISTNAEMARFVRYLGGCRPGDDSHRLIWEAVRS
jgi:hypothetical protein